MRPEPANKLKPEERQLILDTMNSEEFASKIPCNDNPYAESLFKTLKYMPNYQPQGFNDIIEARLWVKNFVKWYNTEHRHSGIQFVTPAERHEGLDKEILRKRTEVYEAAKQAHPERWSGDIRNWEYSEIEWLNPRQVTEDKQEAKAS